MDDPQAEIDRAELDEELRAGSYEVIPEDGLAGLRYEQEQLVLAGASAALRLKPSLPPEFRISCENCGDPVYGELTNALDLKLDCTNCSQEETITL